MTRQPRTPPAAKTYYCDFCGKSQHEVARLIAGATTYICDECIELCNGIIDGRDELAQVGPADYFEKRLFIRKPKHIFYACPFSEPFDAIYSNNVKPAIAGCGWTIQRGDEIFATGVVIRQIWEAINVSEVIVADVTNQSPNVMYEVGMAHALRRHVMIVTHNIDDVPFDLRHHRFVPYKADEAGIMKLTESLVKMTETFDAKRPQKPENG